MNCQNYFTVVNANELLNEKYNIFSPPPKNLAVLPYKTQNLKKMLQLLNHSLMTKLSEIL